MFGKRQHLYCHKLSCQKLGSYKCDGCNVRFSRKDGLTCHQSGACKGADHKSVVWLRIKLIKQSQSHTLLHTNEKDQTKSSSSYVKIVC